MNSIVKSSAWIGLEIYVHGNVTYISPCSLPTFHYSDTVRRSAQSSMHYFSLEQLIRNFDRRA